MAGRIGRLRLVVALGFLVLGLQLAAAQDTAVLEWYSGGQGTLSLQALPGNVDWSVRLEGTTTQKSLMMQVRKDGGPERRLIFPLDAAGGFRLVWLFKDGPGRYTLTFFGSPQAQTLKYAGLGYATLTVGQAMPPTVTGLELNVPVLAYVDSVMGRQVGRGECWDLAQEALDRNLADWTRPLTYGRPLNPAKDEILPGDIIQFRSVRITEALPDGGTRWETLGAPDHTAVVYEVLGPLKYRLAHQNLSGKRYVQVTSLDLNNMTGGQYWIWRPLAAALVPQP